MSRSIEDYLEGAESLSVLGKNRRGEDGNSSESEEEEKKSSRGFSRRSSRLFSGRSSRRLSRSSSRRLQRKLSRRMSRTMSSGADSMMHLSFEVGEVIDEMEEEDEFNEMSVQEML